MTCRALIAGLSVAVAFAFPASAPPAPNNPAPLSSFYIARADPRLCPSPMCGGIWVTLVNVGVTTCGDGARQKECYAAEADLSRLRLDEKGRVQMQRLITEGRAVARGTLEPGLVEGFPELDTLVVSEVWTASSSLGRARGVFHRLRDIGVRCITTPCFSIRAAVLNTARSAKVSGVKLSSTGAPAAERRRALEQLNGPGLVAAGRIVRVPDAGPGGDGRTFVATQFYVRSA